MNFADFCLLFPVVLAIHNFEEYSRYDEFVRAYHSRIPEKFVTRIIIRDAAISLTIAATLLDALTYIYETAALMEVAKVAVVALLLNGIGHCFLSLKQRRLTPGTFSAVTLVLPYSALAIAAMRTEFSESFWTLFRYAALGALAGPITILCFLGAGYARASLAARSTQS